MAANRSDYPDLLDGKPGNGPSVHTPSYVCFNDRTGHFPTCHPLPITESATSIVAADFDGDGPLDLFVPHRDGVQSWPDIVAARSDAPNGIWFSGEARGTGSNGTAPPIGSR